MFTGLSAFPITPFKQEAIDYKAFKGLVDNLASANVDSICAIGSTGLYPYLTRGEKYDVAKLAVDHELGRLLELAHGLQDQDRGDEIEDQHRQRENDSPGSDEVHRVVLRRVHVVEGDDRRAARERHLEDRVVVPATNRFRTELVLVVLE